MGVGGAFYTVIVASVDGLGPKTYSLFSGTGEIYVAGARLPSLESPKKFRGADIKKAIIYKHCGSVAMISKVVILELQ